MILLYTCCPNSITTEGVILTDYNKIISGKKCPNSITTEGVILTWLGTISAVQLECPNSITTEGVILT